jgi:uroporphyrinogen-III synthase
MVADSGRRSKLNKFKINFRQIIMAKTTAAKPKIKSILISQPKPENDKNPFLQIAQKHKLKVEFRQFIKIDPVASKDFRKQKIELNDVTAIILNSRNAIDHFFRIAEEIRYRPAAEIKYFCVSEAIALYLQKYIQYRKRKVFYGIGTEKSLQDLLTKHKTNEQFLLPHSDVSRDHEFLEQNKFKYQRAIVYRTVSADVKDLKLNTFDAIIFFTPSGIRSLFENFPKFKQGKTIIGVFGEAGQRAAEKLGLKVNIAAPTKDVTSMPVALEMFMGKK